VSLRLLINYFTRDLRNWNPERGDSNTGSGKTEIKVVSRVSGREKKISNLNLRTILQFKMHKEWGWNWKNLDLSVPYPLPYILALQSHMDPTSTPNFVQGLRGYEISLPAAGTKFMSKVHEQSHETWVRGLVRKMLALQWLQQREPVFRLTKLTWNVLLPA